jgi:hypothetical protein
MKAVEQKSQRKIRRKAADPMLVYDLQTKMPIGQVIDMSAKGMKIMSEYPIKTNRVYYCSIPLEKKIKGHQEVVFDAECRWCRRNEETSWYNSGYIIRFPSQKDASIIQTIIRNWMTNHANKLNAKYLKAARKKSFLHRIFT